MGWLSVLLKDSREHSLPLFGLATALIAVVLLSLSRQRAAEFSMSSFEVVRFALITVVPLITLIVGNRLIVREYTGGTRRFTESLPIGPATPLVVKLFSGWLYLLLLCTLLVGVAALLAGAAEFIDQRYVLLLLLKTTAIATLYWSIVFFASFTGKLRLLVYLIIGLALMVLFDLPNFDQTRLAPVALIDHQLFIFEREIFPWRDLLETIAISLAFIIAGLTLALVNEGSVAEQLGKPLSRRSFAAITLLVLGIFGVYKSLEEKWASSDTEFSGEFVLRNDHPAIEISYLAQDNLPQAQLLQNNLKNILTRLEADTGIAPLPRVQIALDSGYESTEIYPTYDESVRVSANFSDYNHYEHSLLNTVALHHLLLKQTNGRWDFESRHWLLDGLARWWAEGADQALSSPNNPEHFTRALLAQRRFTDQINPLLAWQRVTEEYGFEVAEALAYTALLYLVEQKGVETILQLARNYLDEKPGSSSLETIQTLRLSDTERFEQITGLPFEQFTTDWLNWLRPHQHKPAVSALLELVPAITGHVTSVIDDNGVSWLEAHYQPQANYRKGFSGTCVLRHQLTSAYDVETEVHAKDRDRKPCTTDQLAHRIEVPYASGDRSYVLLEYEHERFARPIPLWTGRINF